MRMRPKILFRVFFYFLPIITQCSCSKQQSIRYEIIDIIPPGETGTWGEACSINENGDVAGYLSTSTTHNKLSLFFWSAQKKTILYGPEIDSRDDSDKIRINEQQDIMCLKYSSAFHKKLPFIWNPSTGRTTFLATTIVTEPNIILFFGLNNYGAALLGLGDWNYYKTIIWNISEDKPILYPKGFLGSALNDKGILAGQAYDDNPNFRKAAIWLRDEDICRIDYTPEQYTCVEDINEKNEVVGWIVKGKRERKRAYVWSSDRGLRELGCIQDMNTFFNGYHAKALSINNKGQVVGWSTAGTVPGPLIWPVVFYDDGRAFYWDEKVGMVDLNKIVVPDKNWRQLVKAHDINDKGQIVGWGLKKGSSGEYPFLLIPLKETRTNYEQMPIKMQNSLKNDSVQK